ncbi:MAG: hypothetical protein ETSY1_19350 [Candidatus Entotheonella factor]|uniref:Class I SAM-dependent methyltransferase n=1 Tax=Entotheonella factor TaxID=1429438 RepID=W4LK65_ENTF1|nr:MAG: hypothetical protein ETSY1_19350 [Candidatus Entotheonella factor]
METLGDTLNQLRSGDVLFIDSSHEIGVGNDVIFLYLQLIPRLPQGTLIHIHDIFLPYDYPRSWVIDERWGFTEQYLVQALLTYSDAFEVIWASYYLQQTLPQFAIYFPHAQHRTGKSLWLRKRLPAIAVEAA